MEQRCPPRQAQHAHQNGTDLGKRGQHFNLWEPVFAVRAYQRALAIRPTSVVANVGAAKTLLALGRPEAAVSFAKTAAKLEPEDMAIRVGLADSLEASGQYGLAVKELEIAIELGEMTEEILFRMVNGFHLSHQ